MKNFLSVFGMLALTTVLLSSFSIRENPQNPPRGKKAERHIKMVKVDDNGKKLELDTVIHGNDIFVWNGDTIDDGKELKWITKEGFSMDSIHQNFDMDFEYEIEDNGEGNVFIMKSNKDGKRMVKEFKTNDDMNWNTNKGENMFFGTSGVHSPHAPNMMFLRNEKKSNVIDLSDPGIISFDKKVRKDGTEKITIVRKQIADEDKELNKEIIIRKMGDAPGVIHENLPRKTKTIKVIKNDDGKVEIIENEGSWNVNQGDENVKVIKEDGKTIIIREINEGGEKKVEVNVEVEEEKK